VRVALLLLIVCLGFERSPAGRIVQSIAGWHPPAPVEATRPQWPDSQPSLPFDVQVVSVVAVERSGSVSRVEVLRVGPVSSAVRAPLEPALQKSVSNVVERTLRGWRFEAANIASQLRVTVTLYGSALLGPRTGKVVHVDALLPADTFPTARKVLVRAEISPSGRITSAVALNGPSDLREPAIGLARQWQYLRRSTAATTTGIVTFAPWPDPR
jgi:hypothetical protein